MAEGEQRAPQLLGWLSGASVSRRFVRHNNRPFLPGCWSWLPGRGEMALGQVGDRSYPESH